MTKEEAIEAMKRGEKVTHHFFSPDEWITFKDRVIKSEDGCPHPNFWLFRSDASWDTGYSIFNPQQ